jgi:aerobic carbon-monoxide dehydrogenase large subunit
MGEFGIGQPVRRFEDKRLLSGNGRFQNDNNLLGQAHAYVLRSPHAHAASARSTSRRRTRRPGLR